MSLKQIKNKIISTQKTGKVTRAMESVSAVKMRKSQERAIASRLFAQAVARILRNISQSTNIVLDRFKTRGASPKDLLIIVTSDKGLAGSVNSAVIKEVEKFCGEHSIDTVCVGKKATEFATRSGIEILHSHINISDDVSIDDVRGIAHTAVNAFVTGAYGSVHIAYQNFASTFEQKPVIRQMLPLDVESYIHMVREVVPKTGKFKDTELTLNGTVRYIIEPSPEILAETLIPELMQAMVFHALIESKACEHSARMVAMKNATDKSKEITRSLTIRYNKARQTMITAEVSEITAGVEAMK